MHDTALPDALTVEPGVGYDASIVGDATIVRQRPAMKLRRKELERFCAADRDLRIEQGAHENLLIEAPASSALEPGPLSGDPVLAGFTLDLTRVW